MTVFYGWFKPNGEVYWGLNISYYLVISLSLIFMGDALRRVYKVIQLDSEVNFKVMFLTFFTMILYQILMIYNIILVYSFDIKTVYQVSLDGIETVISFGCQLLLITLFWSITQ